jgi:hypothetical protein
VLEATVAGTIFLIVHDLDLNPENDALNDEVKLRKTLESKPIRLIRPAPTQ